MEQPAQAAQTTEKTHTVTITVNNKPVNVEGPRTTGRAIKEAAIAQDVAIEMSFQLAELKGNKREIVGDDDPVTVNKNSKFVATAPDDNS